jgi:ABC-2 type transport system ATP-binding protein
MADISAENISKYYRKSKKKKGEKITALDAITFSVEKGELFGIIGPDGAGKTSLFRVLTTLLLPDTGNATVSGHNVVKDYAAIRNIIGYMPGKFSLYLDLTVEENINFFATLFGTTVQKNYDLVKDIYKQIEPFKTRRAGDLSGGMKQKLALCCALIHKPVVLFLDEPTTGVDAVSRKEFWEMLKHLKEQGITILVSTPYMDEAVLCDRIALMQDAKMLSVDTPANIEKSYPDALFALKSDNMYKLLNDIHSYGQALSAFAFGEFIHVSSKKDDRTFEAGLKKYLEDKEHKELEIKSIRPDIEDCFIRLLKK